MQYTEALPAIRLVWEALNYPCAERLHPVLPSMAEQLAAHGVLYLDDGTLDRVGCRGHGAAASPPTAKRLPIPFEDAARILAAFRGTRWFPLVAVAYATGLRQGELLGLRWQDIDWPNHIFWIRPALKKPGNHPIFGRRKDREACR
ncbi:MAG: tyrosine-type recombinase/integrase [Bacillota bacterium]